MSPLDRLQKLASHFTSATPVPGSETKIHPGDSHEYHHRHNFHTLSPTAFLWRAASIEPHVCPFLTISRHSQSAVQTVDAFTQPCFNEPVQTSDNTRP